MRTLFRSVIFFHLVSLTLWASSIGFNNLDTNTLQKLVQGDILSSIELLPNSKTHRCLLIGTVQAPVDTVWKIISDYSRYSEFMPRTSVTFLIDPKALSVWQGKNIANWNSFEKDLTQYKVDGYSSDQILCYSRFDMPFPLRDRHSVLKIDRYPEIYRSEWMEILGNTMVNTGSWTLASLEGEPGTTLVFYALEADAGLPLPANVLQSAMKKLPEIIRSLRRYIRLSAIDGNLSNR